MKFIKKINNNKGITITDVVIGLMILLIFTGILTSSFYKIYSYNASIRMNAVAVDYCIKILEDIDMMKYEDVNNDLNNTIKEKYEISDLYNIILEIENYNKDDSEKEDIIKIVKINVFYNLNGQEQEFSIKKLKIKEL